MAASACARAWIYCCMCGETRSGEFECLNGKYNLSGIPKRRPAIFARIASHLKKQRRFLPIFSRSHTMTQHIRKLSRDTLRLECQPEGAYSWSRTQCEANM